MRKTNAKLMICKTDANTRNRRKMFGVSLALLFSVGFALLPLAVKAQEATGIRIQPSLIEERVDPGQVFSSILRITNLDSAEKTFYIIKRNISGISNLGTPIFAGEEEETGYEISSWIKLSQESVTVPGKATREIPFSIEVPRNASPGGHFGGIFVSFAPPRPKETGIGIGFQVGTVINLRISGEVFEEAQIREFRADRAIYSKSEVKFMTRVENLGNVLVRPRGPLEITDFFGKKVAILRVNDEGAGVFPKTVRPFEAIWKGDGLFFGRYQVVMSLVYGEEGRKTISDSLSFWVLPLNIILPVVGGILGLIFLVFILVKLHIRRKLREIRGATENIVHQSRFETMEHELLHSKRGAPFSRLAIITIVLLVFTLLFLMVLFFFFA